MKEMNIPNKLNNKFLGTFWGCTILYPKSAGHFNGLMVDGAVAVAVASKVKWDADCRGYAIRGALYFDCLLFCI